MNAKQPALLASALFFLAGAAFFVSAMLNHQTVFWILSGLFVVLGAVLLAKRKSGQG